MKIASEYLLGTPEISLRGRNTLKARRAFTSKPSICKTAKIELTNLVVRKEILGNLIRLKYIQAALRLKLQG